MELLGQLWQLVYDKLIRLEYKQELSETNILNKLQEVLAAISNNTVATNKVATATQEVVAAVEVNSTRIEELLQKVQNGAVTDAEINELVTLSSDNTTKLQTVSSQLKSVSEALAQTNPAQPSPVEPGEVIDTEPEEVELPEEVEDVEISDGDAGLPGTVNVDVN